MKVGEKSSWKFIKRGRAEINSRGGKRERNQGGERKEEKVGEEWLVKMRIERKEDKRKRLAVFTRGEGLI